MNDKRDVQKIVQEVYFRENSDGNITIDTELCKSEFLEKLYAIEKKYELFFNIDRAIEEEINK